MHIHQDQVRVPLLPASDSFLAVVRAAYLKPHGGEQFHQQVPVLTLIVDDQDFGGLRSGTDADDAARRGPPDSYAGIAALDRNFEPEQGSLAGPARNRQIPSHQPRALAADGQSQAGPLLSANAALKLAERLEQL